MGLKQSVVIVNEFSIKNKSGKGGSRGGTPGDYVTRYMARPKATEDLTPVRLQDTDKFITRYMARKEASEQCISVEDEKERMREAQKFGGIAFGYGDVSLSDSKLRYASKDIQKEFERGKTVLKTVLSFDEEYLKSNGIVDEDFEFKERGDYRGNIDQMKLRMAIMNGLDKMSKDYDDLRYVGVIQVDTAHIHCHLAMVDAGRGNIMPDGTQRGKLSEKNKRDLRRGIDNFLDEKKKVLMMTSNVSRDKRNALCYIKKFTHKTMDEHGTPQLLMACLPEDKNLWRASTNRKEMRKANAIVRDYVEEVLKQPDSGYEEAMNSILQYADERRSREDLDNKEYRMLCKNGREQLVEDCMNGVYAVLKQIPDEERTVKTPLLDTMSMDYEELSTKAQSDEMSMFGFRLRSYNNRLEYHKKEMNKYHEYVRMYEDTPDAARSSKVLYDFFKEEEEYNQKLVGKYRHFLSFAIPDEKYEDDFTELMQYRGRMTNLRRLKDDKSLKRMNPDRAEEEGRKIYGQAGGRYAATNPNILETRLINMRLRYNRMEEDFKMKLSEYGMVMGIKDGKMVVERGEQFPFDDVKALDLHHLGYDWQEDIIIAKRNVDNFIEATDNRWEKYQAAVQYLKDSDQELMIDQLPTKDIKAMKELADSLRTNPVLPKSDVYEGYKHDSRTVSLDFDYGEDMQRAVKMTVRSVANAPDFDERRSTRSVPVIPAEAPTEPSGRRTGRNVPDVGNESPNNDLDSVRRQRGE